MFCLSLWGRRTAGLGKKGEELEGDRCPCTPGGSTFYCLLLLPPTPSQPPPPYTYTVGCSFSLEPESPEEVTPRLMLCTACRLLKTIYCIYGLGLGLQSMSP